MRKYKVKLICYDYDNPNDINHYIKHEKELSEEEFNLIYKMIL